MSVKNDRSYERALIVDDNEAFALTIASVMTKSGISVRTAFTVQDGIVLAKKERFDLAFIDVHLSDGNGIEVCRALSLRRPRPLMIAMSGTAVGKEGFDLACLGVRGFLEKPFLVCDIWRALRKMNGISLETAAACSVGDVGLHTAHQNVRRAMLKEAYARGKSVAETARILGVTRQAVQQALDDVSRRRAGRRRTQSRSERASTKDAE